MNLNASLLVWLLIQLAAIALAALRVPLWAQAPHTMELEAMRILLTMQLVGSTLLFPRLCGSFTLSVLAATATIPMLGIATLLSAASPAVWWRCNLFIFGWIVGLGIIRLPFRTTAGPLRLSAVLSTWVASGAVLLFVGGEYSGEPLRTTAMPAIVWASEPLGVALKLSSGDSVLSLLNLCPVGLLLAAAILIVGLQRLFRSRRPSSTAQREAAGSPE